MRYQENYNRKVFFFLIKMDKDEKYFEMLIENREGIKELVWILQWEIVFKDNVNKYGNFDYSSQRMRLE